MSKNDKFVFAILSPIFIIIIFPAKASSFADKPSDKGRMKKIDT